MKKEEAVEGMRQVEVLRAACCIAGADGETTEPERRILDQLAQQAGVGEASLAAMIERSETEKDFYDEQFRVLKADPKKTLQLLFKVAIADRRLKKAECQGLKRLARRLDVPDEKFDRWLSHVIESVKKRAKGKS